MTRCRKQGCARRSKYPAAGGILLPVLNTLSFGEQKSDWKWNFFEQNSDGSVRIATLHDLRTRFI